MTYWRLKREGRAYGPYSWRKLCEFRDAGRLAPGDLIKKEGDSKWTRADCVPDLFLSRQKRILRRLLHAGGLVLLFAFVAAALLIAVGLGLDRLEQRNQPLVLDAIDLSYTASNQQDPQPLETAIDRETAAVNAQVFLTKPARETTLEIIWIWEEEEQIFHTQQQEIAAGETSVRVDCPRPESGWPTGAYRFEVWHDESRLGAARFEVAGGIYLRHAFEDAFLRPDEKSWRFGQSRFGSSLSPNGGQNAVRYENERLILSQHLLHDGPAANLAAFPVRSGDVVTLQRRLSHWPSEGEFLSFLQLKDDSGAAIFSVEYWYDSNPVASSLARRDGLTLHEGPLRALSQAPDSQDALPGIWQESFQEQIIFNTGSGDAKYYINGELAATVSELKPYTGESLSLQMGLAGIGRGHQLRVETLSLEVYRP